MTVSKKREKSTSLKGQQNEIHKTLKFYITNLINRNVIWTSVWKIMHLFLSQLRNPWCLTWNCLDC